MRTVQRFEAQDLMFVCEDQLGWPQDIGVIGLLDGSELSGPTGAIRIDDIRHIVEARLHLVPRFRQLLVEPHFGLGWPYWTDVSTFRSSDHVRVQRLDPPGDERQFLQACEELYVCPLRKDRPLWEMWFIEGVSGGRVGFFMKIHHSIADGVAGVATLAAFLDASPNHVETPDPWLPQPPPSAVELILDNVRGREAVLRRLGSALRHPVQRWHELRRSIPAVKEAFFEGRAPVTSFNLPIGSQRSFAIIRADLETTKMIAHEYGGKVNDVLLAAVAGGYRSLLAGRHEVVASSLRTIVPVSLHTDSDDRANVDGAMAALLPVAKSDMRERLRWIAADTAERQKKPRPEFGKVFPSLWAQKLLGRKMPRQRFFNAYVANVPGPTEELYLLGARLLELFPVVPIVGNIPIGVGAFSYAGKFNITIVADRGTVPDLDTFIEGTEHALDDLEAQALREPASRTGRR